ncbi:MAG: diguanylate cyclase [Pseudomonadota bacterium]
MSEHRPSPPSRDSIFQRRNRDQRFQGATSAEAVLARGHAWLRFPAALESQFQTDTLEPRRKLLLACGLIGCIGVCIGTSNVNNLTPDIAPVVWRMVWFWLLGASLSIGVIGLMPTRWRRNWQAEALTAMMALCIVALLIWMATASHLDTAFTHSATAAIPVIYACIAARQRFVWSLGGAVASFVCYVGLVKGFTPTQALIVASNIKLMAVSYVFVLVANYTFEHTERRNWLLRQLEKEQRSALLETSERLHHLSTLDPLTGLLNRRQFDTDLSLAWSQAALAKEPLAFLMVDVDFFKRYNDTYGHPAGDTCLRQIGQELSNIAAAQGGIATRLGGEEFGLLLPGLTLAQAMEAAAALCENVQCARIEHVTSTTAAHVTVSVGVAQAWPADGGGGPQDLVALSDRGLYHAKESGRNRACAASLEVVTPTPPAIEPSAEPMDEAPTASPAEPLQAGPEHAYMQTLQGRFRWLRFPAAQEKAYNHRDTDQRSKNLTATGILGLIIYNVYVISSRAMFADIHDDALMVQFGLSALLLVLSTIIYALALPARWREASYSLGTAIVGVVSAWTLSQSQLLSALHYSVCLALIPMFSGVGARQAFRYTCVPAIMTLIATAVLFNPIGPVQRMVFNDSLFIIGSNTLYTLILAYMLEYGSRKEWLFAQIAQLQREALTIATQRLHQLSMRDPLTGISNRRQFEDDLQRLWNEALNAPQPLSMLIIDVDFFKLYNDGYGHPAGDRCLKQVAAILHQTAQAARGVAARLGGEEFAILLPGRPLEQAMALGERICAAVRHANIEHLYSEVSIQRRVTVSIGIACLLPDTEVAQDSLLSLADDALYLAKKMGRNRVVSSNPPNAPSVQAVA